MDSLQKALACSSIFQLLISTVQMLVSQIRLPIAMSEVYSGFAEANGLMYVAKDTLIIEFLVKDAFIGVVKSKPKRIHLPFKEIVSIEYKRNIFISRVLLRVASIDYMDSIPGDHKGEIKLKVKRKDKELALRLVSHINLRISEIRLDMMDEGF